MKKIYCWLICLLLMIPILAYPITANADTGPKPSVVVNFQNVDETTYYATLLSENDSSGPWYVEKVFHDYIDYNGPKPIYDKFNSFEDTDGFYFLGFIDDCTEDNQLRWSYYPPKHFKVLLYFPETDQFVCCDTIMERYAFDSHFTARLTDSSGTSGTTIVKKTYDYSGEISSFFARVSLTIAVEIGIALLFGYRNKKALKAIILINIITQIVLNLLLNLVNFYDGQQTFLRCYFLFEFIVFLIEANLYKKFIDGKLVPFKRAIPYALVANIASIIAGIWIAKLIPGIF